MPRHPTFNTRRSVRIGLLALIACAITLVTWRELSNVEETGHGNSRNFGEVITSFTILFEHYIEKPDSIALMAASWTGANDLVKARVPDILTTLPEFTGNVPRDLARLRAALQALLDTASGAVTREEISERAIDAMTKSFRDDHTAFIPPAAWQLQTAGQTVDIGYNSAPVADGWLVWEVLSGSPAEFAGLKPGDIVTSFQNTPGAGLLMQASLVVQRAGATMNVQLTYMPWIYKFLDFDIVDRRIAYLRIRSFNPDPQGDRIKAIDATLTALELLSPDALILDLRNNSGGSLDAAAYLASRLGMQGPFAEVDRRNGQGEVISFTSNAIREKPIVVLVNHATASAAEVLAAGLQDTRRGYLIGDRTRGSTKAVRLFEVAGGAMSVTEGRLYAGPQRRDLDGIGLSPDLSVPLNPVGLEEARVLGVLRLPPRFESSIDVTYDSQIQAALNYLRGVR